MSSRAEATTHGPEPARVIRVEDLAPTPWPNGGGWTREIHRQPSAQRRGQTAWRLSLATIDTVGPFSVLPEVRRWLLLASEGSLHLSIDGTVHRLGHTDTVEFDGGAAVEVIAVSGTSRVLNLMTYGGVGGHLQAGRLSENSEVSDRDTAAIVVLDGHLVVRQASLGRYDTLLLGPQSVDVRSEAATVVRVGVGGTRGDLPPPTSGRWADGTTDRNT
ncbi:HutD family protein [Geodermatophilus normandii]|uniref:HutD family protein n=1 Tax=Geodermatophilus normandii TaxID=1137989 RepID=A0A6P0GIV5_9ACTN|nr:HutD family protein [Geodermatophilus normandii]